jgi:hypothetical protein
MRASRTHRPQGLSAAELQCLSGQAVPGANRFWVHLRGAEKVERCRALMAEFPNLISDGRLAILEDDLRHWS